MRKTAIQMCSVVACAAYLIVSSQAQQQQGGADLTPPPAYTPLRREPRQRKILLRNAKPWRS